MGWLVGTTLLRVTEPSSLPATPETLLICEGLRAVNLSTPDLGMAGPSDLARRRDALNELLAIAGPTGIPASAFRLAITFPLGASPTATSRPLDFMSSSKSSWSRNWG